MHEEPINHEWHALVAALREAMGRHLSPREPAVQLLARRWVDLLRRTAIEAPELLHDYDGTQPGAADANDDGAVVDPTFDYVSTALWAKHFSPDESRRLHPDGPRQRAWPRLLSALREAMNRGTPITSSGVQQLYRAWEDGVDELTAGDAALRQKWMTAFRSDPSLSVGAGIDIRLQHYLRRARLARDGEAA